MYNMVIIEEKINNVKTMINYISEKYPNIRISKVFDTVSEFSENYGGVNADIILLDASSNSEMYYKLINFMSKNELYQYRNSILVKSNNINETSIQDNIFVFSYAEDLKELNKYIKMLLMQKEELSKIKRKISNELAKLNFNNSYLGTKYLEETILEVYKIREYFDGNLTKYIYPIIAEKYNKTITTIYGNIKQAINNMIIDCEETQLIEYFSYSYFVKPKAKEIIYIILNKL